MTTEDSIPDTVTEEAVAREYTVLSDDGRFDFICSHKEPADDAIFLFYTKEEFMGLPKKNRRMLLKDAHDIAKYRTTARSLNRLISLNSDDRKTNKKITALKKRLSKQLKHLPSSDIWVEVVKRVTK